MVARATEQPNLERLRYDLFETLGFWQAFLWTRGTANPLEQGVPMASSALVEYCYEAIQLDLTPGANDRNSAPEHLWNGARWWSEAFGEFDRPIHGRAVIRDPHCQVLGPGEIPTRLSGRLRAAAAPRSAPARPSGSPARSGPRRDLDRRARAGADRAGVRGR